MSQPKPSPAADTQSKPKQPTDKPLSETELEKVSGGKVTTSDITITKHYDKASTSLPPS
jgi:bacteriocin-like protein